MINWQFINRVCKKLGLYYPEDYNFFICAKIKILEIVPKKIFEYDIGIWQNPKIIKVEVYSVEGESESCFQYLITEGDLYLVINVGDVGGYGWIIKADED